MPYDQEFTARLFKDGYVQADLDASDEAWGKLRATGCTHSNWLSMGYDGPRGVDGTQYTVNCLTCKVGFSGTVRLAPKP